MTSQDDIKDASAIRAMFAALEMSSRPRSGEANAVRRWILNNIWCVPRGGYDPGTASWSAAARANPDGDLVREHVVPIGVLREQLLAGLQTDDAYLQTLSRLFLVAVITKAEDRRLTAAGFKSRHPQATITDLWARYRAVGLEMEEPDRPTPSPG